MIPPAITAEKLTPEQAAMIRKATRVHRCADDEQRGNAPQRNRMAILGAVARRAESMSTTEIASAIFRGIVTAQTVCKELREEGLLAIASKKGSNYFYVITDAGQTLLQEEERATV